MIYRMKFEKHDEVKYIGHLDTMRTFTRCIKRTSLPIKFSKGFNPRVQLSFALPLGVGVTSDSEYVDLELEDEVDVIELKKELNSTLPDGFKIVNVIKSENSKSLMSLVKEAIYEIGIEFENDDDIEELVQKIENIFAQEVIEVEKQGKNKKIELVNIKPNILDIEVEVIGFSSIRVTLHCNAGSENNLNPNLVVDKIKNELAGTEIIDFNIHRRELILKD
ncbi:MAG: TIGR03936 family radical SAM-associated protein [Clostridia bacterium]|nr:TIGR03936 family radical SAM-associated protein [Clostridia bacterium]